MASCEKCWNDSNRDAMVIDGIAYPAIVDQQCETCDGLGYIVRDPFDDDHFDYE